MLFYRKNPDKSSYRHIIGVVFAGLDAITGYNLREISAPMPNGCTRCISSDAKRDIGYKSYAE